MGRQRFILTVRKSAPQSGGDGIWSGGREQRGAVPRVHRVTARERARDARPVSGLCAESLAAVCGVRSLRQRQKRIVGGKNSLR